MVTKYGLSEELGPMTYTDEEDEVFLGRSVTQHKHVSEETARKIDEVVRGVIDRAYNHAKTILQREGEKLEAMAMALLQYETIDKDQIAAIMAGLRDRAMGDSVEQILESVLHDTGYIEALEAERTLEAEGRVENLQELVGVAAEFDAKTWAQFFLKYVLSHPAITVARVGTTNPAHMLDNIGGGIKQSNTGVNLTANVRTANVFIQGGIDLRKDIQNTCGILSGDHPAAVAFDAGGRIAPIVLGAAGVLTTTGLDSSRFEDGSQYCDQDTGYRPDVKFSGSYQLPWWDIQASATYQNASGPTINATWATPNRMAGTRRAASGWS